MRNDRIINAKAVIGTMGALLFFEVGFMLLAGIVALCYQEPDARFLFYSATATAVVGTLSYFPFSNEISNLGKREGYIIVTLVWIIFSFFGSLPFFLSGYIPSYTDAFFETISGFTTTGATILTNIEALPHGLLFWRSLIQWLGGMGIVMFSLAILPILGIGGMQLYVAEVPGPTKYKLKPRVTQTAQVLWYVYIFVTLAETIMLLFGGMSLFDAICHSLTTLSTGGYSTKGASIAYWNSAYIEYVVTFFMFIAGINYAVTYYVIFKGDFKKLTKNDEFKTYAILILLLSLVYTLVVYRTTNKEFLDVVREALFQITSLMTGTGFATADFMIYVPFIWIMMLIIMTFGSCAGSASGGIKTIRTMLLLKNSYLEFKRLLHPNAVIPVKMNNKVVADHIITNVLAFVVLYIMIVIISILILSAIGLGFAQACGAAVTCLSNVGPGLMENGPAGSFAMVPDSAKWFMSFLMLTGRLEIFTVLFILTPSFWKRY